MKLTEQHIDQLYTFTRKHFVDYYDLQTELVDHLAQGIEQNWEKNATISFDDALSAEFKKFGVFGFSDVVEQRRLALTKRYNTIVWKHFKEFFSVPKIFLTALLIYTSFKVLQTVGHAQEIIVSLSLIGLIFMFFKMTKNKRKVAKKQSSEKKWLLDEIIFSYGDWLFICGLPMQIILHISPEAFLNPIVLLVAITFVVSLFLLKYVMIFSIPEKSEDFLLETHPEYKFSK